MFDTLVSTARLTPLEASFTDFQATGSVRAGSSGYLRIGGSGRPETAVRVRDAADQPLGATMQVWVVRLE